ncbi:MAG: 6-chlorohydroxyquinol-1,2-dioxygenase, partial [bacterium]
HFIVSAAGHRTLTTSLYVQEDPYIDQDAVFGVRDSLVVSFKPNDSAEEAARFNLKPPFWKVEYDFGLSLGQE